MPPTNSLAPPSPLARRIARELLKIGAVAISPRAPFTWASGLKAPVYCDNRITLSHPRIRNLFTEGFLAYIKSECLEPAAIVGTATGGIAHAAWLAHEMQLPMAYVRSNYKPHGRGRHVEGGLASGQSVVVVEDLVSTGRSSWRAVEAVLNTVEARVLAMVAIFTYEFEGVTDRFMEAGILVSTLCNFSTLLSVAVEDNHMKESDLALLRDWHGDPRAWSAAQ